MKYIQKIANDNRKHALNGLLFRNGNIVACDSIKYIETTNPFELDLNILLHTDHTNIIDEITRSDDGDNAWIHRNDMQTPAVFRTPEEYPDVDAVTPDDEDEPDASMKVNASHLKELAEALDRDCPDDSFQLEIHTDQRSGDQLKLSGDKGTTAVLQGAR